MTSNNREYEKLGITVLAAGFALSWIDLLLLPFTIGLVEDRYGVNQIQAGALGTIQIGALTVTILVVSRYLTAINKTALCVLSGFIIAFGNLFSAHIESFYLLIMVRVLIGVGLGVIGACTSALAAQADDPEKAFTILQFGLSGLAAVLIFLSPALIVNSGLTGVYYLEFIAALIIAMMLIWLPEGLNRLNEPIKTSTTTTGNNAVIALLALGLLFVGHDALWAYCEGVGSNLGLSVNTIGTCLSIGALLGLLGAFIALKLGMKYGFGPPAIAGFLIQIILAFMIYSSGDNNIYLAGILTLNMGIVFLTPYMMAVLANLDAEGKIAAMGPALINIGSAVGPLLAGVVIHYNGYDVLPYYTLWPFTIGLLMIMIVIRNL